MGDAADELGRERLGPDVFGPVFEGVGDKAGGLPAGGDPVLDLEPGLLTQGLDAPHDLPGEALETELLCYAGVERDLRSAEAERLDVELLADDRADLLLQRLARHGGRRQRLAHLQASSVAGCQARLDGPPRGCHLLLQAFVPHAFGCREVGKVNAALARQVAVHGLGEEGHEGRYQPADRDECLVQRLVGRQLVAVGLRLPETAAGAPHVPGREVGDQQLDGARSPVHVVLLHRLVGGGHEVVEVAQKPAVEDRPLRHRDPRPNARCEAVDPRVGDEEGVHVPERYQVADHLVEGLGTDLVALSHRRGEEEPADRVRTPLLKDLVGVHHVAARLRRLLSLLVEDVAQADHVPERVLLEEQG